MRIATALLFVGMVIIQWAVPAGMIFNTHRILKEGTTYRFRTQPVDPADPFRGNYLHLNFPSPMVITDTLKHYEEDEVVYVSLKADSLRFAYPFDIHKEKPANTDGYLKLRVRYAAVSPDTSQARQSVYLEYPFDKMFLEESKASDAEQAYWNSRNDSVVSYVVVKVLDTDAVLVDVIVNDSSVVDIVKRMRIGNRLP